MFPESTNPIPIIVSFRPYKANSKMLVIRRKPVARAKKSPESIKLHKHAYYEDHQEVFKARSAAYRKAHPEHVNALARLSTAKWKREHPEQVYAQRRERSLNLKGTALVTRVYKSIVFARDGGKCHICHKLVDPKDWHLDHLIPLSLGGPHTYENVAVSHPKCNMHRSNTGPAQLRLQ